MIGSSWSCTRVLRMPLASTRPQRPRVRERQRAGRAHHDGVLRRVDQVHLPSRARRPARGDGRDVRVEQLLGGDALGIHGQRHRDRDDERCDQHGRDTGIPALGLRPPQGDAPDAVDRHHDQPAEQDRTDVREEQHQRSERLPRRVRLQRQADDRERRHERDRDRDPGQGVRHVVADDREGRQPRWRAPREVDELRVNARRDLRVVAATTGTGVNGRAASRRPPRRPLRRRRAAAIATRFRASKVTRTGRRRGSASSAARRSSPRSPSRSSRR